MFILCPTFCYSICNEVSVFYENKYSIKILQDMSTMRSLFWYFENDL